MENPKQISCKISLELDNKIRKYLQKHNKIKSTSELVKTAINDFLEQEQDEKKDIDPYYKNSIYKRSQEELDRENQIKNELEPKLRKEITVEIIEHLNNENHDIDSCALCDIKRGIYEYAKNEQKEKLNNALFMNKSLWFESGIKWKAQCPDLTSGEVYNLALAKGIIS